MSENKEKGKILSRRAALKATGLAALALGLTTADLDQNLTSKEQTGTTPYETIREVRVYGREVPLDQKRLDNLKRESNFSIEMNEPSGFVGWELAEKKRKEALPENEMMMEVLVQKSVYDRWFDSGGKTSFVDWVNLQIHTTNETLVDSGSSQKLVLGRIIVLSDDFVKQKAIEEDVFGNPRNWEVKTNSHNRWVEDNFGVWPYDIDSRWMIEALPEDLERKIENETSHHLLRTEAGLVDAGLVHEWLHHLFLGDYEPYNYSFSGNKGKQLRFLSFTRDAMSYPKSLHLSPLSVKHLEFIKESFPGVRSAITTSKSLYERIVNKLFNGYVDKVKIQLRSSEDEFSYSFYDKSGQTDQKLSGLLSEGFETQVALNENMGVFILGRNLRTGEKTHLPVPRVVLTKVFFDADIAEFSISISPTVKMDRNKDIYFDVITGEELISGDIKPYAHAYIPNNPSPGVYFVWYQSDEFI